MRGWFALGALALGVCLAGCQAAPPASPRPADEVEALVAELASPVPPPHPDQDHSAGLVQEEVPGHPGTHRIVGFATGYEHPRVTAATARLVALGTRAYPRLIAHLDDERYSFSRVSAAWMNYSVGTRVREILAEGIEFHAAGYKSREHPGGEHVKPGFSQYLAERDAAAWARAAAGSTKDRLRRDYVAWVLEQERAYGFQDEAEAAAILGPYLEELARLDRELGLSPGG
ncbi:MAG TPA: hypothetical protein PK668_04180 [Myxococcota bacterium]|nr:hypothetical protein [Myxococcota bacterium]HRY92057.1 hypothetical protein [Myxococcota bacterium]HSA23877.1 hypothetical protein [Myxococcota bacterium]